MIRIKNALKVQVTLVLKLNDFITGEAISIYSGVKVMSGDGLLRSIAKEGGYYVFTERRPDSILITSDKYGRILLDTSRCAERGLSDDIPSDGVLRLSLVPRVFNGVCFNIKNHAHVGFGGREIYAVDRMFNKSLCEIQIQKDNLADITDLFHALVGPDGEAEPVYITRNLGNGRFALKDAPKREYPTHGTRLIPLNFVMEGKIPVLDNADTVYILSEGRITVRKIEEYL